MQEKKLSLIKIPLSRLLKIEMPRFAERVLENVEEHNPELLEIKELYDLLVAEQPKIDKLIDRYGPHPLNRELDQMREMRSLYLSGIRYHLKKVIKEDKSRVDVNVIKAKDEINHLFQNLELSKNEESYIHKITQFFAKISTDAELQNALSTLSFTEHLDSLKSVHKSIQEKINEKVISRAERPVEKTAELRKSVLTATQNLIKQIEIAPLKNPEIDYAPLYKSLNILLVDYRDQINRRVLANKRKAEKSRNENGIFTTTSTTQIQSTERMMGVRGNGLEAIPVKNEEEAAAMPSKAMQLPLVNEDDEA